VIVVAPQNAGEKANFIFSFISSLIFSKEDSFLLTFPKVFDAYLGSGEEWFNDEPGVFYVYCTSE
jgi:hypothetical protein